MERKAAPLHFAVVISSVAFNCMAQIPGIHPTGMSVRIGSPAATAGIFRRTNSQMGSPVHFLLEGGFRMLRIWC